jgi:hypothetical protein
MKEAIATTVLCATLAAASWWCLTTTLTDMTIRDCEMGQLRACEQLAKDAGTPLVTD